jgi:hypothetical protein
MPATIEKGSTGEDVFRCQQLLTDAGYPTSVDGVFGSGTEKQVKGFQSANSLTSDGIVGSKTWAALEAGSVEPQLTLPVDFQTVADLFPQMMPQKYRLHDAQCPSNPPGITLKNIGDEWTNCVQFTAWLLSYSFSGVRFSGAQWKLWMVSIPDQGNVPIVPNWGPKVALEWGVATTAPERGAYLIQYFTSTGGHSLIVVDRDPETDKILTLESNSAFGLDGAGWGEIGNLRDVLNPGLSWREKVTQTWESRFGSKIAVHMARLEIKSASIQSWLAEGP